MIGSQIYRRYLLLSLSIISVVMVMGILSSIAISRLMSKPEIQHGPAFLARTHYELNRKDPRAAFSQLRLINQGGRSLQLALLDQTGHVLESSEPDFPTATELRQPLPQGDFEFASFAPQTTGQAGYAGVIRMPYQPPHYLMVYRSTNTPHVQIFLTVAGPLVVALLIGVALAIFVVLRSLRNKVEQADTVIARLQSGDLKARFAIGRNDEFGQAMQRFNRMADQIQHLVERLRETERARVALLQDLAHDLRTPIASLAHAIETLRDKAAVLKTNKRDTLLAIATREAEYFDRLVEDLLFLALVSEPRYSLEKRSVDFSALIENEIEVIRNSPDAAHKGLQIDFQNKVKQLQLAGDRHLFQRVIRNALGNACSFARKRVLLQLDCQENDLCLSIEDDGPGFSESTLHNFGHRRDSRMTDVNHDNRISVGLGSVIMRVVTELHGGTLTARNLPAPGGACIKISLPRELAQRQ